MNSRSPGASTRMAGAYGMSATRSGSVWISPSEGLLGERLKAALRAGIRALFDGCPQRGAGLPHRGVAASSIVSAGELHNGAHGPLARGAASQARPRRLACPLSALASALHAP